MNKKTTIDGPIYDARQLGTPKMLLLGLQHMFAMFGATVLVPALTGLDVATALLFAGIGTLLFHLLTGGKGSAVGCVIGALILGIITNLLNLMNINTYYQFVLQGVLLILTLSISALRSRK